MTRRALLVLLLAACGDEGLSGSGVDAGAADSGPETSAGADGSGAGDVPVGKDVLGGDAGGGGDVHLGEVDATLDCPGGFGCPCNVNEECDSNWCVPSLDGLVCTQTCIENCPAGWTCQAIVNTPPDITYICAQVSTQLCKPCDKDSECTEGTGNADNRCVSYGGIGSFCGIPCGDACPEGYTCDGEQCVATVGDCPCPKAFWNTSTTCSNTSDAGTCSGKRTCGPEGWEACTAAVPAVEACNGKDDDCDGATDEDVEPLSCGLGVCAHQVPGCVGGVPQACNPFEGAVAEVCNGKDDDCDGETDELWPDKGTPCDGPDADLCAEGGWVCSSDGGTLVCEGDDTAHAEVCDGQDNDCDGDTDEASDLGVTSCGLGVCEHQVPNCLGGVLAPCDPMEGAEAEDEPDPSGLDSDCDGLDGTVALGVFVDGVGGKAGNPGTREEPLKTIAQGIAAAQAAQRPHVYVSQGIYAETVELQAGISLFGGYSAKNGWGRSKSYVTQIQGGSVAVRAEGIGVPTILDGFTITSANTGGSGASSIGVLISGSTGVELRYNTIEAGAGGAGAAGAPGSQGATAGTGTGGQSGCENGTACIGICGSCAKPVGGAAGTSPCGAAGGKGGDGGDSGGKGGDGGKGGGLNGGAGGPGGAKTQNGTAGTKGGPGAPGQHGAGGGELGEFTATGYFGAGGAPGGAGGAGSGGGGGGGGGGDEAGCFTLSWCKTYGSSGGGGGGGGCGGTPGGAGGGGGGSFGVLVYGGKPALLGNAIASGAGGTGGAGGQGGLGGSGGPGGPGGAKGDQDSQGVGLQGGDGGNGGAGGAGGGGGGGPSVAVVCSGGAAPVLSGNQLTAGFGGAGGGSAGNPGAKGLSATTFGCF
ncbi:MAG: hypothetical protein AMXMBFR64_15570 [Myxococcales bacterium]